MLAGGERRGRRATRPRCITDVPADSEFARLETFGPVAAIEVVDTAEAAVARANDTSYGLSAGILTRDADRGFRLAQQLESGIVHVNDQPVADEPQMPFGGVKDSGFGRFGGQAVIDEFTELRWITVKAARPPLPVLDGRDPPAQRGRRASWCTTATSWPSRASRTSSRTPRVTSSSARAGATSP